jgi:acyl-CoA thioesterase-1
MRVLTSFILFITLVSFSTASENPPVKNILVVGDSLSAGYGLKPDQGWVTLLQQRLQQRNPEYNVVNASITGDTTQGGLARLPAAIDRFNPAVVIIELGGNDGLRGFRLQVTQNNLDQMIQISQQANARVLLLGVQLPANYGRQFREKFQQIFIDLANSHQIASVPFFLEGVAETRELMQPDGIHPAAEAQPVILNNVWPALKPLLD